MVQLPQPQVQRGDPNHTAATLQLHIDMGEHLTLRGELIGHGGWVTALATTPEDPDLLLSASRDKVS